MQRDLESARSQWQQQERRRRAEDANPLPGALGLLMDNKDRLRGIGFPSLFYRAPLHPLTFRPPVIFS